MPPRSFRPGRPATSPASSSRPPRAAGRVFDVLRTDWPRLMIELVVLVAGISISFALEEWRTERENRRTERRALEAIRDNLVADTLQLASASQRITRMLRAYDGLIAGGPADSLDTYMDLAISYVAFGRTDAALQELRQTGTSRLLRNRALLNDLLDMYSREYMRAAEWDNINRNFILERMIPYLDANSPYVASRSGGEVTLGMAEMYRSVRARDHFRNLVKTNQTFKEAQRSVYGEARTRARDILRRLDAELATGAPARS